MTAEHERPPDPRVGLCAGCEHARTVTTARGSTFWRCNLSTTDPRFPRYPPLPVRRCAGFKASANPSANP